MTWLIAIARNLAIDRLRARPDAASDDEGALDAGGRTPPPAPKRRLIAMGEARRIADCFATLEADRAEAVRGAYLRAGSYQRPCRAAMRCR